MTMSSNQTYAV